jgi:hypothetical protein
MSEERSYEFYFKFGTMSDSRYHNPAGSSVITLISATTPEDFAKQLK